MPAATSAPPAPVVPTSATTAPPASETPSGAPPTDGSASEPAEHHESSASPIARQLHFEAATNRACTRAALAAASAPSSKAEGPAAVTMQRSRTVAGKLAALSRSKPPAALAHRVQRLAAVLRRLHVLYGLGPRVPASISHLISSAQAESVRLAADADVTACAATAGPRTGQPLPAGEAPSP